jgi:hypothetical protein
MVAGIVGVALWVAVASLGEDGASPALTRDRSPSPKTETAAPVVPPTTPAKPPRDKPPKPEDTEPPEEELITEGITVQVLNASGTPGAEEPVADQLTDLGFEIEAVVEASKIYEQTTVFWSTEDSRAAAEALAARFDWIVEGKPENLSTDVSVHVVVGQDELT